LRKTLVSILVLSVITVLTTYLPTPGSSSPASIEVVPVSAEKWPGEFLIVNITVSDVTDLYLWMFRLRWNKTVLQLNSIREGPFLEEGGDTSGIMLSPMTLSEINGAGRIEEAACSLVGAVPGVSGSGTIATLNFTCLSLGSTSIEFWEESPLYKPATDLLNSDGVTISHTAPSATVNVIPEFMGFATILLLIAVLFAVILGKKVFRMYTRLEDT